MCLAESGSVFVWGRNENGCLGIGINSRASQQIEVDGDTLQARYRVWQ